MSAAAETLRILRDSHAILEDDHFVYDSGLHGSGWIDKDAIYPHTERTERLCRLLAEAVRSLQAEIVCGPATGGLVISQWTAHALGALSVFCDHGAQAEAGALAGRFVLRRGYDRMVAGRRVLVVDDIVNTGLSVRETTAAVRAAGGNVVGIGALVNRGSVDAAGLGVDAFPHLLEFRIPSWPEAECPLCREGRPVNVRYAHGADYFARRQVPSG